ncbi:LuxR family transcriptional regulator [Occultella glacieicola]|uniref:LuxR family transcriptional regulator n=1 Tax=Occultella glacieicola TaxID=2518684 RepID=A0ABY2E471_9MICO|nr:LuxR family transcriptional regulator [Occultella glacieicola]TDE94817.1 LuxR family transcriptional regulator [Occultella glacieicola]
MSSYDLTTQLLSAQPRAGAPRPRTREADPVTALRDALATGRWSDAARIIGGAWGMLIEEFPADLDAAFQTLPLESLRTARGVAAVREIWLATSIEPQHIVPADAPTPPMAYAESLHDSDARHQALADLTLACAHMVAARIGGRYPEALEHADRVGVLSHLVETTVPAARRVRQPLALLQAGITRGLAGDVDGAVPLLQSAYERCPYGRSPYVAKGAAGNLALLNAIRGDVDIARRWLARHDEIPSTASPHTERVLFTGDLARALVAIETLDGVGAAEALSRLEQGVNVEQSWGPVVTFLHARHALVWGDRHRALSWLRRDSERYAARLGPASTMGPLLAAAQVDLLLSVGRGDQALARLNRMAPDPILTVGRARLELLAGCPEEADRLAAEAVAVTHTSRVRLEGLVVRAAAAVRGGRLREAREAFALVQEVTGSTGLRLPLAGLADPDRRVLLPEFGTAAPPADGRERSMFPSEVAVVRLTNQELLMLRGLASFRSQRELADAMYLSLNTVKTHLRAAYQKLGVSSRAEALTVAAGAGLL